MASRPTTATSPTRRAWCSSGSAWLSEPTDFAWTLPPRRREHRGYEDGFRTWGIGVRHVACGRAAAARRRTRPHDRYAAARRDQRRDGAFVILPRSRRAP